MSAAMAPGPQECGVPPYAALCRPMPPCGALPAGVFMYVSAAGDAEQGEDAWTLVYLDGVRVLKIVLEKKRAPQRDGRGSGLWPQLLHGSLDGQRACRAQMPPGYACCLSLQHVRLAAQVWLAPCLPCFPRCLLPAGKQAPTWLALAHGLRIAWQRPMSASVCMHRVCKSCMRFFCLYLFIQASVSMSLSVYSSRSAPLHARVLAFALAEGCGDATSARTCCPLPAECPGGRL